MATCTGMIIVRAKLQHLSTDLSEDSVIPNDMTKIKHLPMCLLIALFLVFIEGMEYEKETKFL